MDASKVLRMPAAVLGLSRIMLGGGQKEQRKRGHPVFREPMLQHNGAKMQPQDYLSLIFITTLWVAILVIFNGISEKTNTVCCVVTRYHWHNPDSAAVLLRSLGEREWPMFHTVSDSLCHYPLRLLRSPPWPPGTVASFCDALYSSVGPGGKQTEVESTWSGSSLFLPCP